MDRRIFFKWMGLSTLPFVDVSMSSSNVMDIENVNDEGFNPVTVDDVYEYSLRKLGADAQLYLNSGADHLLTLNANVNAFKRIQIRAKRLVDVSSISTQIELFGMKMPSPVLLSPVANQKLFHNDGEIGTAKGAKAMDHIMIASSLSNYTIERIKSESEARIWFQLYPTNSRDSTKKLIRMAEQAGCEILIITIDSPIVGKRHGFSLIDFGDLIAANYEGILGNGVSLLDQALTWDFIKWLRNITSMKIILKGIVTHEDASQALKNKVDGIIVSNHGGRQLDSNRSTIECLPEVVEVVNKRVPVLIDSGIRNGTDIFKALAIGADAVCIGRPFCWGLASNGQLGVAKVLEILHSELVRTMKLAGTPGIEDIKRDFIKWV